MLRTEKILFAGILAISALALVSNPRITGFMTGGCKDIVENVTELLPYQDEICAQIPFVYNQCENQDYKYSLIDDCKADNSVFTIICTLTNLEDKAGEFDVSYGIINKTGERNGEEEAVLLESQSSHTFKFSQNVVVGNCYCELENIPKKEVCYDVLKTKEQCYSITKYKEVVKQKNVTKC